MIFLFSVGRSDLDRYNPIVNILKKNKIKYKLILGGVNFSNKFGKIKIDLKNKSNLLVSKNNKNKIASQKNIADLIKDDFLYLSQIINKDKPNIIIVLGDKIEMLVAAYVATIFNVPTIHLYGGAITMGAIDDSIRHAITHLSHFHLVAHDDYKKRLIKMGIEKKRIKTVGLSIIDTLVKTNTYTRNELTSKFKLNFNNKILFFTLHPETVKPDNTKKNILKALRAIKKTNYQCILCYPNADYGSETIINSLKNFVRKNKSSILVKNLDIKVFVSLLKYSSVMVGNSSAGIVEASTFKLPVVNIGDRQKGKIQSKNIINCSYETNEIYRSIKKAISVKFSKKIKNIVNPYGDGKSSEKIFKEIKNFKKFQNILEKKFTY